MGHYRGITVGPVFAKLFAMILEQRIASGAEEHAVKAKGQAGFRKDFCTTNNIFILRSLIIKQKQSRHKGKSGKLYCCFVDFWKAFDTVPGDVLWQVLLLLLPLELLLLVVQLLVLVVLLAVLMLLLNADCCYCCRRLLMNGGGAAAAVD